MIYFTSDLHFSHKNIINYCERPFEDVHEMNKFIIEQINSIVKENDELYILGDFCHHKSLPITFREKINCKKVHLILGNHDLCHKFDDAGFESIDFVKEITHCNQKIFMSHYPHRSWPSSHKGCFHLYGHTHSKLNHEDVASNKLTLDVGVDNTVNYGKPFGQPWSFKELQVLFSKRKQNEL